MALSTNGLGYIQESKSLGYIESGSTSVPGFAKVHCSTAASTFVVDGANDLMFGPELRSTLTATAINSTDTVTAAQLLGGILTSTTASAVTMTLPTAALLVAALGAQARVGSAVRCHIVNLGGTNAITVAAGSGMTLDADQTNTVAAGVGVTIVVHLTNVTSGSEAANLYFVTQ